MRRLRYIFYGFRHFFVSHSRHGTHSPFVYKLAEEVIYKAREEKYACDSKPDQLLNEIADYFGVTYTLSQQDVGESKALCVQDAMTTVEELAELQHQFHYLVFSGIYDRRSHRRRWQKICLDRRFIVTIDLFFFGLVFFRTQQPKQHFKLRFPFWK